MWLPRKQITRNMCKDAGKDDTVTASKSVKICAPLRKSVGKILEEIKMEHAFKEFTCIQAHPCLLKYYSKCQDMAPV